LNNGFSSDFIARQRILAVYDEVEKGKENVHNTLILVFDTKNKYEG